MIKKNIFSIIIAGVILYLSVSNAENYNKISLFHFHGADYLIHFLMYFGFMSVIVLEHRKEIYNIKNLLFIALIPFFYGILMELLQLFFTVSRTGSVVDTFFNLAGILCSTAICLLVKPVRKSLFR
jgi:VanZ family protein